MTNKIPNIRDAALNELLLLFLGLGAALARQLSASALHWTSPLIIALAITYVLGTYIFLRDKILSFIILMYMMLDTTMQVISWSETEQTWPIRQYEVLVSPLLSDISSVIQIASIIILIILLVAMGGIHEFDHTTFLLAYRWITKKGDSCLWTGLTLVLSALLLKYLEAKSQAPYEIIYMIAGVAYIPLILSTTSLIKPLIVTALAVMLVLNPVTILVQAVATDAPKRLRALYASSPRCTLPIRIGRARAVLAQRPVNKLTEIGLKKIRGGTEWGWLTLGDNLDAFMCLDSEKPAHALIVGSTGTGKSFIMHKLIQSIAENYTGTDTRGTTIIVIDAHGEYADKLRKAETSVPIRVVRAGERSINIFETWNDSVRDHIEVLIALFRELYHIGPIQESLLREILVEAYLRKGIELDEPSAGRTPTFKDLRTITIELAKHDPRARPLLHYIENLATMIENSESLIVEELLRDGVVIVDLSALRDEARKKFYGEILLKALYSIIVTTNSMRNIIIAVDEAHIFARKGSVLKSHLVRGVLQLRKYGVFFIVATQTPRQLDRELAVNTAYKIVLPLYEPEEARYTAKLVALHDSGGRTELIVETLAKMPRGYAMYRAYFADEPLLIEIS